MKLNYDKYADGLVPAIVQDADSGVVLMLGFMHAEALMLSQQTGRATFYSRSRQKLWTKGETSGNFLQVLSIVSDCDNDGGDDWLDGFCKAIKCPNNTSNARFAFALRKI